MLFRAGPDDFGIDQHQGFVALFGDIDDHDALVHVDLRGRQADAVGVVHRGEHVLNQRLDACIDGLNRLCNLVKTRIRVTENGKNCHE